MRRRSLLAGIGAVTAGATAGCTSRLFGGGSGGTVLAPQEDQLADSEDLSYPAYGQRLHAFELRDPIAGVTVDSEALDRTAIVTGVSPSVRRSAGSSSDASSASRTAWPRRD